MRQGRERRGGEVSKLYDGVEKPSGRHDDGGARWWYRHDDGGARVGQHHQPRAEPSYGTNDPPPSPPHTHPGQGPDMVLMPMRDDDGLNLVLPLVQEAGVRKDLLHA